MFRKLNLPSAIALICIVFSLFINASAQAQNDAKIDAANECSKVLQKAAKKEGKEYANRACDSNVYPVAFWQCVDKEMDSFDLNMSIYFCEKSYGFK